MNELAVWWHREKVLTNFGDELGPAILKRLGYKVRRVKCNEAELITVGSILQVPTRVGHRPGLKIWGSGFIADNSRPPSGNLEVLALRGRRSAAKMKVNVPLGDPGLLVSRLWDRSPVKYRVGVVPHYVDKRNYSWADKVIDVRAPVDEVIADITSCASIQSSSLHGLIVAESFGIPAMRLYHQSVRGYDFKWSDYHSAWGNGDLETIQNRLLKALEKL